MLNGLIVPQAVLLEYTEDISAPGTVILQALGKAGKFEIIPAASLMPIDAAYAQGLGGCEVAVLSDVDLCCAAQNALLVIVDERRARRVAARLGVPVNGSGTLIAQLKRQGLVQSVKPVLSSWKEHGYFVLEPFVRDILRITAEL